MRNRSNGKGILCRRVRQAEEATGYRSVEAEAVVQKQHSALFLQSTKQMMRHEKAKERSDCVGAPLQWPPESPPPWDR
jgi:hypothetical protein